MPLKSCSNQVSAEFFSVSSAKTIPNTRQLLSNSSLQSPEQLGSLLETRPFVFVNPHSIARSLRIYQVGSHQWHR
jgi:hypothetical protein